jgi:hypothetical protein
MKGIGHVHAHTSCVYSLVHSMHGPGYGAVSRDFIATRYQF